MTHTIIPSVKGQVTIPSEIRAKYSISKETPIVVKDEGKGVIVLKVMHLTPHDDIEYFENDKESVIVFKNGIDPKVLIDEINKIDG